MSRAFIGGLLAALLLLSGGLRPAPLLAAGFVEGRVLDASTGEPLADVSILAANRAVTTERDGRFRIAPAHDSTTVVVRRIGYRTLTIRASELRGAGDLRLARAPVVLRSLDVAGGPEPARCLCQGSQLAYATTPRAAIAAQAAPSLAEAIESAEGVSSSRPGSWGAKTYLRGLGGERVVVMLDGNRIERACNVGMDGGLATIHADNVERVEILSGPGSTLYGSGNVGGVINVVTRAPRDVESLRGEIRASASSEVPGGRLGGTLWGRHGRFSFTASADGSSYGDQRSPLGVVGGSSFRDLTVDAAGSYAPTRSQRIDLRAQRYAGRDIGYPGSGDAFIPEEDRALYALDYGWQWSGRWLDGLSAKAYLQTVDHHMTMSMMKAPATPGGMPMRSETDAISETETWGGRVQARLRAVGAATLDAGLEAAGWNAEGSRWVERTKSGTTSTMLFRSWPGVRVTDLGAFAQGGVAATPWLDASAGARFDRVLRSADGHERTTESVVSGNVGLRARHENGLYVRTGLGFGYRIPDPTELFGILLRPDGFVYLGDPDLATETSRNVEFSIGYAGARAQASATLFRNRLDDYISTVVSGDSLSGMPIRRYANVATARLRGVSGSVAAEAAVWLRLRGSVAYTEGENRDTGDPLPMVAPLEGSAAARIAPAGSGTWIEPEVEAATKQTRAALAQGEVRTPGFVVWNVRAGTAVGRTSFTAGIENVFDDAYRRHLDPARLWRPGRNVFAKVTQRF
ncbi:MAG TPA: TonB-dependent receptor [Acidobacteriota bacterium]|nr:TonB-dependent receptor [Acidobacteriota bacterium]